MIDNTDADEKILTIKLSVSPSEPLPEKMTLSPYFGSSILPVLRLQQTAQLLESVEMPEDTFAH